MCFVGQVCGVAFCEDYFSVPVGWQMRWLGVLCLKVSGLVCCLCATFVVCVFRCWVYVFCYFVCGMF